MLNCQRLVRSQGGEDPGLAKVGQCAVGAPVEAKESDSGRLWAVLVDSLRRSLRP